MSKECYMCDPDVHCVQTNNKGRDMHFTDETVVFIPKTIPKCNIYLNLYTNHLSRIVARFKK